MSELKEHYVVYNNIGNLEKNFGNVKLSGAYVPSFDCKWNFASSIMR